MKKSFFSFILVIIFFTVGFFLVRSVSYHSTNPLLNKERGEGVRSENIKFVKIAGTNIKVNLALTPASKQQGLSGTKSLDENRGMLFVFTKSDKYLFWMKDMNFPIDIIWISEDMKVIYIKKDACPELYPETYGPTESDGNAKYVLEVVSGFSDKNNLKVGDRVLFTY